MLELTSISSGTQLREVSLSALEQGRVEESPRSSCCSRITAAVVPSIKEVGGLFQWTRDWYYAHTNRLVRNMIRVSVAGGMSTIGGGISGDPRVKTFFHISAIAAVWIGSGVGGFGNGLSTWLAWETDTEDRITILETKITELSGLINSLRNEACAKDDRLDECVTALGRLTAERERIDQTIPAKERPGPSSELNAS